ncbi:MAG: hypothetical protein ABFD50_23710 [Smithella sp.]
MKPTLNLFFDVKLTSKSPDAQVISLGIVSDELAFRFPNSQAPSVTMEDRVPVSKSFYSEFSDFSLDRCDAWVKENVVGKLKMNEVSASVFSNGDNWDVKANTNSIKEQLKKWLSQFSDYNIQFVGDCATFDWYHLLQLIGEWEIKKYCALKDTGLCQVKLGNIERCPSKMYLNGWDGKEKFECQAMFDMRFGLPKLPDNISQVPQDLNDLISLKKGISVREAFDLDREREVTVSGVEYGGNNKHNSLFDAKIIKTIYNNIK